MAIVIKKRVTSTRMMRRLLCSVQTNYFKCVCAWKEVPFLIFRFFLYFFFHSRTQDKNTHLIPEQSPQPRPECRGVIMGMKGFLFGCVTVAVLLELSSAGLVKKVIRHRRDSLAPTKTQENLTLPHPDQPVVFNHVYNINVPATSLCSVHLDSPGDGELKHKGGGAPMEMQNSEYIEHTLNGDNQIVFTHRINIPKQACGCDNQLGIKDILSRLEMLESELSGLREQCGSGTGCCGSQVTGQSISFM